MNNNEQFDALLIGAGPAGSSAAALLAEQGHNVLLIEREKFPRYHIGESLLPFTYEPLKRLGLINRMRASAFIKKYSVQFVSTTGLASQPFYFNTRYDDNVAQTWQVLRSEFDQMLLVDKALGFINWASTEYGCRRCHGLELALRDAAPARCSLTDGDDPGARLERGEDLVEPFRRLRVTLL